MNIIENYCSNYFNNFILSKINTTSLAKIPKVDRLIVFFIINIKQYKKNLFIFYILVNLIFGGLLILKTNIRNSLYIINLVVKRKSIFHFLQAFVNFYLPLLSFMDNTIKLGTMHTKLTSKRLHTYRINYFSFPVVPELDKLTENYESLYNFVNNYKMQLDISIVNATSVKNCPSFLLRMYR